MYARAQAKRNLAGRPRVACFERAATTGRAGPTFLSRFQQKATSGALPLLWSHRWKPARRRPSRGRTPSQAY